MRKFPSISLSLSLSLPLSLTMRKYSSPTQRLVTLVSADDSKRSSLSVSVNDAVGMWEYLYTRINSKAEGMLQNLVKLYNRLIFRSCIKRLFFVFSVKYPMQIYRPGVEGDATAWWCRDDQWTSVMTVLCGVWPFFFFWLKFYSNNKINKKKCM